MRNELVDFVLQFLVVQALVDNYIRRDGGATLMVGLVDIVTVGHCDLFQLRGNRRSAEYDTFRVVSLPPFAVFNVDISVIEGLGEVIRVRANSESIEVYDNFTFLSCSRLASFQCSWRFIEKLLSWCNVL